MMEVAFLPLIHAQAIFGSTRASSWRGRRILLVLLQPQLLLREWVFHLHKLVYILNSTLQIAFVCRNFSIYLTSTADHGK